jgi:hypothetical protein
MGAIDKCESFRQGFGLAVEYGEGLTNMPQSGRFVSKIERWLR